MTHQQRGNHDVHICHPEPKCHAEHVEARLSLPKPARFLASIAVAALLAGCGGGASSSGIPSAPIGGNGALAVTIKMPGSSILAKNGHRVPLYTSRATKGVGISFGAHGTYVAATTIAALRTPAVAASVAPGAPGCDSAAQLNGSFNCTIYVPGVPAGFDDLQITLWDTAPSGGTFASPDNDLSTGVVSNIAILSGQSNTVAFSVGGVVDSVILQTSPSSFVSGTNGTTSVSLVAKDTQGNIIVGSDNYVDQNGAALTFTLASSDATLTVTGAAGQFPNPSSAAVTATYSGVAPAGTSATISATPSSAINGSKIAATVTFTKSSLGTVGVPGNPTVTSVSYGGAVIPFGVATDSAGNVWSTDNATSSVREFLVATHAFAGAEVAAGHNVWEIALAGDGRMCMTQNSGAVEGINCFATATPGTVTHYPLSNPANSTYGITQGPDGNIWFTENGANQIGSLTATGLLTEYAGAFSTPHGIAAGPDGDLWVVNFGAPSVSVFNPVTHTITATYGSAANLSSPENIVAGPDGNMWVSNRGNGAVTRICVAAGCGALGTATAFATGLTVASGLTAGPDGNIWANDGNGSTGNVAAITTSGSKVKMFAMPDKDSFAMVWDRVDGNIYQGGWNTNPNHLNYFTP